MAESLGIEDYRSQVFRERVLASLDQRMSSSQNYNINTREIENLAFERATSRESYLQLIKQILALKVREAQRGAAGVQFRPQAPGMMGGQPRALSDPLNALQSMARQGSGPGAIQGLGQPGQPMQGLAQPGQPMQGLGQSGLGMQGLGQSGQPMQGLGQGGQTMQGLAQPGQSMQGLGQGGQGMQGLGQGGQGMQGLGQPGLGQGGQGMQGLGQAGQGMQVMGGATNSGNAQGMLATMQPNVGLNQNVMLAGQLQGGQQMPGMGQPRQQMQSNFQQLEGQAGGATRLTMVPPRGVDGSFMGMRTPQQQAAMNANMAAQNPPQFQQFAGMQPNMGQGGMQRQSLGVVGNMPVPQPIQPQPSQMTAMQNNIVPSPAQSLMSMASPPMMSVSSPPGITLSPAGALRSMAPSPGHPGSQQGQGGSQVSPAGMMVSSTTPDDQLYADKLKQLQKFVEPLRRMIARMENGNDTTNVAKLRNLLEVLVVPNKKVPLQALLKCETVLERLDLQMQAVPPSGSSVQRATVTTATAAVPVKEQQICQPLMDAILSLVNNPAFNHAAQRTFAPPLQVLHGSNFVRSQSPSRQDLIPSPPPSQDVPHILQQEVALLGQRFSVTRDPTWATGSDDIHLVCSLEARNLPTVPPLNISIPSLYPDVSPVCHSLVDTSFADDSSFLQTVYRNLHNQLVKMPDKYTLSSLLNAWELSVRSASHSQSVLGSAY